MATEDYLNDLYITGAGEPDMEENKVATDKELRERADKLLTVLVTEYLFVNVPNLVERQAANAIFRELVAVRNATIKDVLRYEADVAAYQSYCADRGEKP